MWVITNSFNGKPTFIIGSSKTNERDTLNAFFSLYRAPNEVIWKCREPTSYMAEHLNYGSRVRFYAFRKGIEKSIILGKEYDQILNLIKSNSNQIVISIEMAIISKNWFQGTRASDASMKMILIPFSKFALKSNDGKIFYQGGTKYEKRETLGKIFKSIENLTGGNCTISTDKVTSLIEYKNYITYSSLIDTIDKISTDNLLEYFYDDGGLRIGKMVTNNTAGQLVSAGLKYSDSNNYKNTLFKYSFNYKAHNSPIESKVEISSGGYADTMPLPGTEINLFNKGKRVVYLNYSWSSKHGHYSSFIGMEKVRIPQEFLYELLPEEAKEKMAKEYIYKHPNIIYADLVKYVDFKSGETIRRHANLGVKYTRHDPENIDFEVVTDTPVIFESNPYAGDEVGVQYPKNVGGKVVALAPDAQYGNIISVAQVFQDNKMPLRSDIEDYRVTLPNGGTVYYDTDKKMNINVTKSRNILAVDSDIAFDKVPGSTELSVTDFDTYIQLGKSNEDGGEYVLIKTANNEIKMTDGKVSINGGSIPVAREGDATVINSTTDSAWITWLSGLVTVLGTIVNEPGNGAQSVYATAVSVYLAANPVPTSMTGKVNEGNANFISD